MLVTVHTGGCRAILCHIWLCMRCVRKQRDDTTNDQRLSRLSEVPLFDVTDWGARWVWLPADNLPATM